MKSISKLYRTILQSDSALFVSAGKNLFVGLEGLVNGILRQQLGKVIENYFQFFKENNQQNNMMKVLLLTKLNFFVKKACGKMA